MLASRPLGPPRPRRGFARVPPRVRQCGAVLRRGEPADARRPALHVADLRPGLEQPERADADCPLDLPGRRLCIPGGPRPDPLARGGAGRDGARPAPRAGGAWRGDPARRCQLPSRRWAPAGPRPRSDPRLPDWRGSRSLSSICLGFRIPGDLFPHPSLARSGATAGASPCSRDAC